MPGSWASRMAVSVGGEIQVLLRQGFPVGVPVQGWVRPGFDVEVHPVETLGIIEPAGVVVEHGLEICHDRRARGDLDRIQQPVHLDPLAVQLGYQAGVGVGGLDNRVRALPPKNGPA